MAICHFAKLGKLDGFHALNFFQTYEQTIIKKIMAAQPNPPGHVPPPEIRPYDQGPYDQGLLNLINH